MMCYSRKHISRHQYQTSLRHMQPHIVSHQKVHPLRESSLGTQEFSSVKRDSLLIATSYPPLPPLKSSTLKHYYYFNNCLSLNSLLLTVLDKLNSHILYIDCMVKAITQPLCFYNNSSIKFIIYSLLLIILENDKDFCLY